MNLMSYPFWRRESWLSRFLLLLPTLVFTLLSFKFIADPVHAAAQSGITIGTGLGITDIRVGFGAFPLALAMVFAFCLVSERRLLTGLAVAATVMTVVLAVRLAGMLADHTVAASMKLVVAEAVFAVLSATGIVIEKRRRSSQQARAASTSR